MKLCLVMKDYNISHGGAERQLVQTASMMARNGYKVDILANRFDTKPENGIGAKTVKAITWSSVMKPLTFNISAQKILKKHKYDIVYGLTQIYPQDVYRAGGGLVHDWLEIKNPCIWRRILGHLEPRMMMRLFMENCMFKKGNFRKIITNSYYVKYQILKRYRIPPDDIRVVYNGLDKDKFNLKVRSLYNKKVKNILGIPENDKVILFISNNWPRKGLKELFHAFSMIKEPRNLWLVAAGRGKMRSYLGLVKKLGISDRVCFAGEVQNPWAYYGAADLFVLPTYYDPFSNVVLEALNCGVPVITTMTNGAREIVIEGVNGYLLDKPSDTAQMTGYMKSILFGTAWDEMSRNSSDSVKEFSVEKNVQETLAVFNNLGRRAWSSEELFLTNNGYREIFRAMGWDNVSRIINISGGALYKKNKFRSVVMLDCNGRKLFLKRHFTRANPSWAVREWRNIYALLEMGISTMKPVAVGENIKEGKSFLFTEALEKCKRLEEFIPEYFSGTGRDLRKTARKRELARKTAELTKKLHDNNYFHKDYYTGHIFVDDADSGFELYLIDLQRLTKHYLFEKRWRIKDLASLNYSCEFRAITRTDKFRFMKHYLGSDYNKKTARNFIRSINIKTERIKIHTNKKLARKSTK